MNKRAILTLDGISKTYGGKDNQVKALEDVSLQIYEGEIFGVIGLSGAGKSTLVRCLNLLERPTSGRVFFEDKELTSLSDAQLRHIRRSISMIFQGFHLLMQRTVLDNVAFPLRLWGMGKSEARGRAQKLLQRVGLLDKASAYPNQLSGGQKQRVAIARALATEPKVLLCDEVTSALDPSSTESIMSLLKQLNRDLGVTLVIITHEMKVVEQNCSRVAIMDNSRLMELGEVESIFRSPKTEAAQKLIWSQGELLTLNELKDVRCLRMIFDGMAANRPIVSELMQNCGQSVNIAFADTRTLSGRLYGQMIVQLPSAEEDIIKIKQYLDACGVVYEEVR